MATSIRRFLWARNTHTMPPNIRQAVLREQNKMLIGLHGKPGKRMSAGMVDFVQQEGELHVFPGNRISADNAITVRRAARGNGFELVRAGRILQKYTKSGHPSRKTE